MSSANGPIWSPFVAGIAGGVVSTAVLHPLDLLKIRLAADTGLEKGRRHYSNLRHAVTQIYRYEGWPGFYKGMSPNLIGASLSWGLYFFFFKWFKTQCQDHDSQMRLTPLVHMAIAAQSGILTLAMTNPIWVVKTRLCLQVGNGQSRGVTAYRGFWHCLSTIYREEGVTRGLYKGLLPGLLGVSHGAIQFMAYEEMKAAHNVHSNRRIDAKLDAMMNMAFAASSKVLAAVATYPFQVIRTRLQDEASDFRGTIDCISKTYRNEGCTAFYKGLIPQLMRVVPATVITFLVYENVSHLFTYATK